MTLFIFCSVLVIYVVIVNFVTATMPTNTPRKGENSSTLKGPDTLADEVAVPCFQCDKMVSDKGVLCRICDNWYCHPCIQLTSAVLKTFDNLPECLM